MLYLTVCSFSLSVPSHADLAGLCANLSSVREVLRSTAFSDPRFTSALPVGLCTLFISDYHDGEATISVVYSNSSESSGAVHANPAKSYLMADGLRSPRTHREVGEAILLLAAHVYNAKPGTLG